MFKHRGWTEKVYLLNLIYVMVVIQEVLILSVLFPDSPIVEECNIILPTIFAELTTFSGFIVWKNKNENMQKFKGGK